MSQVTSDTLSGGESLAEPPAGEPDPAELPAEAEEVAAAGETPQVAHEGEPGSEPGDAGGEPAAGDEGGEAEAASALGMSEREFERAAKTLDRAVERYRVVVAAFMEQTGQSLIPNKTDLDFCPGYIFHPDVRPLDEEQAAFARALLGMPLEPPFEQDPESHPCDTCAGWGRVKTGSKVGGESVVACPRCNGHGFITSREYTTPAPAVSGSPPGELAPVLSEAEQSGEDAWGTPRSHHDWGKAPQYRSANWQAELDAYKRGEPAPAV